MAIGNPTNVPSAGELRSSVQVLQNNPTQDAAGGWVDNYSIVYSCRGMLRQQSGHRSLEVSQLVTQQTYKLFIRYTTSFAINTNTRLIVDGNNYSIVNWEKVDQKPHWYKFILAVNPLPIVASSGSGSTSGNGSSTIQPSILGATSADFINDATCPLETLNGMDIDIYWVEGQKMLTEGTDWTPYPTGGFIITIPGFKSSKAIYHFDIFLKAN
jgi:SPP1 family predicted phage head-tail adaptor